MAGNAFEPNQAFRVGACAWGVQFHPEFDADVMHSYVEDMKDELLQEGLAPEAVAQSIRPTLTAASLLRRFAEHVGRNELNATNKVA